MTRSRYRIFEQGHPHFMTCTVVAWLPVFSQPAFAEIILDSWRFLQRARGVDLRLRDPREPPALDRPGGGALRTGRALRELHCPAHHRRDGEEGLRHPAARAS